MYTIKYILLCIYCATYRNNDRKSTGIIAERIVRRVAGIGTPVGMVIQYFNLIVLCKRFFKKTIHSTSGVIFSYE